jgi:hypothetical protein
MGMIIRLDDTYVATFIDLFNLRFRPAHSRSRRSPLYGGIAEMTALQREFQIFREGRLFVTSAALLGLGGLTNDPAKNRWFELLGQLPDYRSDRWPQENGDQRIVRALISNFDRARPLPCFMRAHDGREDDASRVVVRERDTPLFYLERVTFLTISLPMRPETLQGEQARRRRG